MNAFTSRRYRSQTTPRAGEIAFQVVIGETDLRLVTTQPPASCAPYGVAAIAAVAAEAVRHCRGHLQAYMLAHPAFGESLVPVTAAPRAHPLLRAMAHAARVAEVGPMAAVAGGVAEWTARALAGRLQDTFPDAPPSHLRRLEELAPRLQDGTPWRPAEVLVENGGDLFMLSARDRVVGLLAAPTGSARVGVRLPSTAFPLSLCASSGRFGHSLSLGRGDLVVVRARCAVTADAAATALCNLLGAATDVERVLERAQSLAGSGVEGVFAQCDDRMGAWGAMELTAL